MPVPHRQHVCSIMDVVLNSPFIAASHVKVINWCRLYMNHFFLSELASPDGKYLAHYFQHDSPPSPLLYSSEYLRPCQGCPNKASWKIYTGQLRKFYVRQMAACSNLLDHGLMIHHNGYNDIQHTTQSPPTDMKAS
eukprot:11862655-Ditylum_brightwellii.AAC.1